MTLANDSVFELDTFGLYLVFFLCVGGKVGLLVAEIVVLCYMFPFFTSSSFLVILFLYGYEDTLISELQYFPKNHCGVYLAHLVWVNQISTYIFLLYLAL